jgi:transcriptional regulator with XRE-family HTH domain
MAEDSFGQRLKKVLAERNMMQKELAEKIGVNEMAISRYIHGGRIVSVSILIEICKVLNVTPEWLLSGVETHGTRSNPASIIAVDAKTDAGILLEIYNSCDAAMQARILGYAQAIREMAKE